MRSLRTANRQARFIFRVTLQVSKAQPVAFGFAALSSPLNKHACLLARGDSDGL